MTTHANSYEDFARRRERLGAVLNTLAEAFRRLEANARAEALLKSRETLHSDTFKVMVVGEFKRGKSTLINALLGQSVLPAKVAPCTAVITRIRYGDRKRAVLLFKDGRAPLEISLEGSSDELKKYITIQDDEDGDEDLTSQAVNKSPYAMADVFYPLPLCRNNVEIVDSPGLNEHKTRTEVTKAFFAETDAMIVVLSCEQALAESERRFIEVDLQGRDLRDVFFLWNRFDAVQDSPEDAADIRRLSRDKLEPRVGTQGRIFFVSGKDALMGRRNNQAALLARSNVPQFEAALEQFLSNERGRVKLRNPLRLAESAVREGMLELIPHRENLLRQPLEEVRRKLEQQRPQLEEAERQQERLVRSVDRRGEALTREVEASYRTLAAEMENGLRTQVQLIQPTTWQTIASRTQAKEHIAKLLDEWMSKQVKKWEQEKLAPLVQTHLKELEADLDDRAKEFLKNLDTVKAAFAPTVEAKGVAAAPNVSPISRLVGGGVGLFVGGIGSAMEGATMGAGQMAKGLGVNLAVGVGLAVAGFGLPVILPALAAIGLWRTVTGTRRQADDLRTAAVAEIVSSMRSQQPTAERELQSQVKKIMDGIRRSVAARMSVLVDEVRGQVQGVIQEREQHQGAAERELAVLASVREELAAQMKLLDILKSEIETA
jgi:GTPase SAR1 family protein